jgi:3-dehydroquinate dehydratase-2
MSGLLPTSARAPAVDALEAVEDVPKVEIHRSNVHAREAWRRHSVISPVMNAVVAGMGPYGYEAAVGYILTCCEGVS